MPVSQTISWCTVERSNYIILDLTLGFNGLGKANCKTRRETVLGFSADYTGDLTICEFAAMIRTWWRHQMETFPALLAICARNSPVSGELPTQRLVTRSVDVFFDQRPNKRLGKQSWGWWFETHSLPLCRHSNELFLIGFKQPPGHRVFHCWISLSFFFTIPGVICVDLRIYLDHLGSKFISSFITNIHSSTTCIYLLVDPYMLPRLGQSIHTRKQTRGNEFISCSNN